MPFTTREIIQLHDCAYHAHRLNLPCEESWMLTYSSGFFCGVEVRLHTVCDLDDFCFAFYCCCPKSNMQPSVYPAQPHCIYFFFSVIVAAWVCTVAYNMHTVETHYPILTLPFELWPSCSHIWHSLIIWKEKYICDLECSHSFCSNPLKATQF